MSLRLKLVLLVTGLLTLVLAGLALAMSRGLEGWTLEVVDGELARRAQVLLATLHVEDGRIEREGDDDGPLDASRGWPWRVETTSGQVLLREGPSLGEVGSSGDGAVTITTPGGRLRVWTVRFTPHGEHDDEGEESAPLVLRVGAPLAAFSGLADRVWLGLALALVVAVALGVFGALGLAQVFLAPLHRLTSEAHALDATPAGAKLETSGLDPDLRRLAEAFNGVLARLSTALEAQRAFTARASHALRTPLAAVLSQAEVALRREREAPAYREALDGIASSARESARLVEGLLAVSRADAAPAMDRAPLSLAEVLAEVQRLFEARAQAKSLTLSVRADDGVTVVVSRSRLRELLDALVDNALVYTPSGGTVRVEALARDGGVDLEVRDSGPGIPPAEREQVFERFFRGSAGQQGGHPGSGLGLAVVRAVAASEGATVSVDEAPEGGARLRVRFPRS